MTVKNMQPDQSPEHLTRVGADGVIGKYAT
jgi:hypothetical protein